MEERTTEPTDLADRADRRSDKPQRRSTVITTIGEIVRGQREVFPPYLYEAYRSTIRRAPSKPLIDVPLTLSELTGPGTGD